ncbi:hypothetical protein KFL_000060370 [Klebsormidium nitens]|uniref:Uncharacterized protein n=1 Tax=Klebsormidium nitens TaxID=105231 RepID=A0A0U9I6B8_KLENI|nr:hypothetical protein KFL_000060370 [Klebsormidium nitens]|eukprot:GAQ77972.1 hypothetical protein KFL_000060370 [Klebsormidium nitens]
MDYTLPAPKFFVDQLAETEVVPQAAEDTDDGGPKWKRYRARGVTFQRVWLQGVLLASDEDLGEKIGALDDGTGVIELDMSKMGNVHTLRAGAYILVIGPLTTDKDDGGHYVKVHKLVDLTKAPNREAIWFLEVIEADKMRTEAREAQ